MPSPTCLTRRHARCRRLVGSCLDTAPHTVPPPLDPGRCLNFFLMGTILLLFAVQSKAGTAHINIKIVEYHHSYLLYAPLGQRCHAQGDPERLRRRDRAAVSCTSSTSSEDFAPSDRLPRPFFAGRASSNSSSTPAVLLAPFSRIASLRLIPPISLFCGRLSAPGSPGRPLPARHPQHERPQECAP